MRDPALGHYRKKYAEYSGLLRNIRRIQRNYVFARLTSFLLMIFVPLAFTGYSGTLAAVSFFLLLVIFLILVKKSVALDKRASYLGRLLEINLNEIEALRGNLTSFEEGNEFVDPDHPYSFDMDIFGSGSLFQFINRCCTWHGKEKLAAMMLTPETSIKEIYRRQETCGELAGSIDLCQEYIATGSMFRDQQTDRTYLLSYIDSPSRFSKNRWLIVLSKVLPVMTIVILVLAFSGVLPFSLFLFMFLLQLGITGILIKNINEVHNMVGRRLEALKKYGKLLLIIENAGFVSPLLKSLKDGLESDNLKPSHHIRNLANISSALDNRLNMIASILLNGMLLWDLNCVLMLECWNRRHRRNLPLWLETIATLDAFISFGIYRYNNPGFVFPVPRKEGGVIQAKNLGHPLIPAKARVPNDFEIDHRGRFIIITGANMAGKSTFLRTAGVAMILAMAGAPVCADEFRFQIMELYSSMRTNDSLTKHESYFYAELKRLKHLTDRIAQGKQVLVVLDEILKGTNSDDKQKGSAALLERLIGMGATGIIATHDLSLTLMEQKFPSRIRNQCFEVEIEGEKIYFDYKLRDGVTRKMNALLLMKQMGLLTG